MKRSLNRQATQKKPTTKKRPPSLLTIDESHESHYESQIGDTWTGSPPKKVNMNDSQKQKLKKKQLTFSGKKQKRNRSPVTVDIFPKDHDNFFHREILPYEYRTVNSAVELTDAPEEITEEISDVSKKKKRKPKLMDSEIDLVMTRPRMAPPKPIHRLTVIREGVEEEILTPTMKEKMVKKKKNMISEKITAVVARARKFKPKEPALEVHEAAEKYPVLNDKELVKKFMTVPLTNNQKGRIRLVIKEILRGTSPNLLPEVLNNKIQTILRSSQNLTDSELRKIRILYNMLRTETGLDKNAKTLDSPEIVEYPLVERKKKMKTEKPGDKENKPKEKEKPKVKGIKRYVVFVGNMPLNVTRQQIMNHFNEIRDYVKDIRIPSPTEDKKSAIAYVELTTGISYEMALSKHHSMMGGKRINVLYTTQKKSKVSKADAKAKSAKLIAMQKGGQLVGSIPLKKKRSQRRLKQRQAQRAAEKALEKNQRSIKML